MDQGAVHGLPTPPFDTSGALAGAVSLLVDIRDYKRAEEFVQR